MKNLKYTIIRLALITVLFFVLNEIYLFTFWKSDVHKHADTLENLWNIPTDSDAIYFGESSNFHETANDLKKHRISEILDTLIEKDKISTLDNAGLHAGTYLAMLQNLPSNMKLKYIIVTMNMRSFGQVWINSDFETNLSKLERLVALRPKLWNRFMISLNEYDLKSSEERKQNLLKAFREDKIHVKGLPFNTIDEWDFAIANAQWQGVRQFKNEFETLLATQYVKNFAFEINPKTNPRIANFDAIVEWANSRNCEVFFNILGENMEEGAELVGPTITSMLKKNRDLVVSRYSRKGAIMVDNLSQIPDRCFADRNWPTEHYELEGKKIVAKNLANAIQKRNF